ncbi:MAG: metal ABC transporter permease [Candidatus Terrybacteria bacterium]|nr:metal ABC transporter permease [Candidatus Terrybacteria bacterium]
METASLISVPTLLLAAAVGAAAGYVGAFMILRRLALVGDALTHVALPGLGAALTLGFNPFLGAFTALTAAVVGVWFIETRTRLYMEALVGVFFTIALAVGILITPEPELFEALFGDIADITPLAALAGIAVAGAAMVTMSRLQPALLATTIAPDLAKTYRVSVRRTELSFLLVMATTVAIGITAVGTLLMGALVIIPAITAKRLAKSFRSYATMSIVAGISSAVIGVLIAARSGIPPGVAVVLVGATLFSASLLVKPQR